MTSGGLNEVAVAAAKALAALGFQVAGWVRRPRESDEIEVFSGRDRFGAFLARSEILVNLLPLTAETRGIIIADTKFEFGFVDGKLVLADEVLTPDSSRFWPKDDYSPGGPQPSFDKQYVRNYLEEIHWNKQAPAPSLPPEVVKGTQERYLEAYRLLTGQMLQL